VNPRVKSVTIERGLASLKQDSIDAVQLLHYKAVDLEKLLNDATCVSENAVHLNRTAEVAIFYGNSNPSTEEDEHEMVRTVLERMFPMHSVFG
jgi:hypothetical protein